jgi:hypothetical protein
MPQGKKWLSEEYKTLAIAFIQTSEELEVKALKGTGQTGEQFWKKVMVRLEELAPRGDDAVGRYHNRGLLPVWNQWKDNINRNVKGFNKCLLTIYKSNPTGVTEDEKINMAIAIHVGKVDVMNYRMAQFEPNDWKLYQAWLVLKDHPAFLPPPQPNAGNTENLASDESEDESTEDDDSASAPKKKKKKVPAVVKLEDDDRKIKSVVSGSSSGSVQVSTKKSRGVGGGRAKTKEMAERAAYRQKKVETINKLTQIQEKRSAAFEQYVNNQARLGAFHMASMRFKQAMTYDPQKADYYSHKMDVIMGEVEEAETKEDEDDDEFDFDGITMEDDFGKMAESMPVLPVPAPVPAPARVAKAARRNEPDDENELDEPPAQPRRSGRSAVAAKPATSKRTKTKRAAV